MKKDLEIVFGVGIVILAIVISGVFVFMSKDSNGESNDEQIENVGIANPASVNCIEKGGVLEIVDGVGGQYGLCKFEDGSLCEEWAFFRGECNIGEFFFDLTNR